MFHSSLDILCVLDDPNLQATVSNHIHSIIPAVASTFLPNDLLSVWTRRRSRPSSSRNNNPCHSTIMPSI
uniref:Uncharacterized protein n=1 Tax=Panagrellus redivivus TaxID=6233 RepID=A0A7E4WDL9_PANRE